MSDESAEPGPVKPKRKHKGLKIVGGVFLVLIGISAVAHTNTSATLKPGVATHHSTKTISKTPTKATRHSTKTVSKTPTKAAQTAKRVRSPARTTLVVLQTWMAKDHIDSRLTTLHTALEAALTAMGKNNSGTAGIACHAVSVAATHDLTVTAPIASVETPWQAMLYDFQNTAAVCLQFIADGVTAQTISTFSTDVGNTATQLGQFNSALLKIVGAAAK